MTFKTNDGCLSSPVTILRPFRGQSAQSTDSDHSNSQQQPRAVCKISAHDIHDPTEGAVHETLN